jgi:choline dehydrogenase-like flavoprotein
MADVGRAEFDFVIVGAGSAGCVLAGRLSENPNTRVLLLEAGTARRPFASRVPAAFSKLFKTRHDWAYFTEPEPALGGRRLYVPRGKLVGGSSAMNAMIYIRGNPLDFDAWAAGGADGWSYADVLPFFERAEDQARGKLPGHGVGGPLRVEDLVCKNPLSFAFVEACGEVGIAANDDFNGGSQDGAGFYQVTQKRGSRWSAADGWLFPVLGRPNLVAVRGAHATRVVFEKGRASGVEYALGGQRAVARAAREVILAAGAIGSPQLLLLSGVGPADDLARHGIAVVADVPGVGQNLMDHPIAGVAYACKEPISLLNAEGLGALARYVLSKNGPLTSNVAEAGAFVRSSPGLAAPDLQYHFAPAFFVEHGFVKPPGHGFSVGPALVTPLSRGRLTLRSPDPFAPPRIEGRHMSEGADMKVMVEGLKLARRILGARAFDRYRGAEFLPGAQATSDADLEAHVRATAELLYHPAGTCKMGKDAMSVVDPTLRVRQVEGLRVADTSVMPVVTRGNTNASTLMIAERLAAWLSAQH